MTTNRQNIARHTTFQLVVLVNLSTVFHETISTFPEAEEINGMGAYYISI